MDYPKAFRKEVARVLLESMQSLMMYAWNIKTIYHTTPDQPDRPDTAVTAKINVLSTYKNATLHIYPHLLSEYRAEKEKMREVILHELIHCLTQDLYDVASDRYATPPEINTTNEKLVQGLTRILLWNYKPIVGKNINIYLNEKTNASRNPGKRTKVHNNGHAKKRNRLHG